MGPYALRIHPALLEGNTGEPLALSGIMDHMRVMERKARSKGSTQKLVLALFGSDGLLLFIDFQQPTVVSPQAWLTALSEIYNPNPIKAGWFAIGLTPELAHDITLEFLIGLGAPMEVALRGVWFRNADGAFVIQLNGAHFQGKANASYTWNGVTATLVTRGQHATIFGDVFPRNTRGSGSMRLAVKNLVSSARGPSLSADKDDRLSAASIATRDARHRAPSSRDRDFISLVGLGPPGGPLCSSWEPNGVRRRWQPPIGMTGLWGTLAGGGRCSPSRSPQLPSPRSGGGLGASGGGDSARRLRCHSFSSSC